MGNILYWNRAFEKVGLVGAIEVHYQDAATGAHMEKDPEDVRYNFVRWLNFVLVKNARWHDDRVVLLGDALHTAHFSIGSGTKLALEDAIALAQAFAETASVHAALEAFARERKPVVDSLQEAARESLLWFEHMAGNMALEPIALAYRLMTRSGRIDHEKLRRRDPAFVAAYESASR